MTNTPKNFALQLGALITLYASIAALITLLFSVITMAFPDAADSFYTTESSSQAIRFSLASLIVVFPMYLWLTRSVNQVRRREEGKYLTLTKWLVYISLLIGGGVLVGDVIAVLYAYLNGEITIRFILKAAVLAVVMSAAFYYYLKDAQGYWQNHETQSMQYAGGAVVLVVASIVLGFYYSETPASVREAKIDDNQIGVLQDMQWRIEEYYRTNETLPTTLSDIYRPVEMPAAPEDRAAYEYNKIDDLNYELCAEFAQDSAAHEDPHFAPMMGKNYNWGHAEGWWCFERQIDDQYRQ